jgi:phage terminase Nu1 subunit (DNA packaging protein)
MTQPPWIVSKKQAAQFFRVSVQALDGWFNKGAPIAEKDSAGRIKALDLSELVAWRDQQRHGDGSSLEAERTRLTSAQANKTELEVQVLQGTLLPAQDVERVWGGMIAAARAKLLNMPSAIAPQVRMTASDAEASGLLRARVVDALAELRDYQLDDYLDRRIDAVEVADE